MCPLATVKAMLSDGPPTTDAERVRTWLARAFIVGEPKGMTPQGLADHCGVSAQAVYGWRHTGRITKSNLQKAISYFGHAPSFGPPEAPQALILREPEPGEYWPFQSIRKSEITSLSAIQLKRLEATMRQRLDEWAQDDASQTKLAAG